MDSSIGKSIPPTIATMVPMETVKTGLATFVDREIAPGLSGWDKVIVAGGLAVIIKRLPDLIAKYPMLSALGVSETEVDIDTNKKIKSLYFSDMKWVVFHIDHSGVLYFFPFCEVLCLEESIRTGSEDVPWYIGEGTPDYSIALALDVQTIAGFRTLCSSGRNHFAAWR